MDGDHSRLKRANRVIWVAIAATAAADLAAAALRSFEVAWHTLMLPVLVCGALAAGGWIYRTIRPEERLASALTATAQLVSFAAVAAPLSYLAASANRPLWDATFTTWDHSLAIDWVALLGVVTTAPWLHAILQAAYASFYVQAITTVLALSLLGHLRRLTTFLGAFIGTTLLTIGLSVVFPAVGPWLHYAIDATAAHGYSAASQSSWPVFLGLRDGTVNTLTALDCEGVITFPSLHAALGILFMLALWRVRGLRLIAVALNFAMIAATPIEGSHYIVDVIAGITLAAMVWLAVDRLVARTAERNAVVPAAATLSIIPDVP
jgi:hypothetical protein